ncbi:MAG: hypothetical protein IJ523_01890 [Succinivibrionaceae bacterium]|nr:hypothetical protein [Succinivibrionaceae bacterium]
MKVLTRALLLLCALATPALEAAAETMDSFACLLSMHEKKVRHDTENSCRVAIIEEQDLMVFLIGQEYINLGRLGDAKNFYRSYLNSGYHEGAVLGLWAIERFILGNVTDEDPDIRRDQKYRQVLREASLRGDRMAQYILKGYKSKSLARIKSMAEEGGNVYAAVHYIFVGPESIREKRELIRMAYRSGYPMGDVMQSIYDSVVKQKGDDDADLRKAYDLARSAAASGSQCANLPLSIFYQHGKAVNKDVKEATKLFSLAKKQCWYAQKNSDVAWR